MDCGWHSGVSPDRCGISPPPDVTLIGLEAIGHNSRARGGRVEHDYWIVSVSRTKGAPGGRPTPQCGTRRKRHIDYVSDSSHFEKLWNFNNIVHTYVLDLK